MGQLDRISEEGQIILVLSNPSIFLRLGRNSKFAPLNFSSLRGLNFLLRVSYCKFAVYENFRVRYNKFLRSLKRTLSVS